MSDDNKEGAGVPVRECGNGECGWKGTTERMLGSVGPLCPRCGETTEPAAPSDAVTEYNRVKQALLILLQEMHQKLELLDQHQPGYQHAKGWNAALVEVMNYVHGEALAALSRAVQPQTGAVASREANPTERAVYKRIADNYFASRGAGKEQAGAVGKPFAWVPIAKTSRGESNVLWHLATESEWVKKRDLDEMPHEIAALYLAAPGAAIAAREQEAESVALLREAADYFAELYAKYQTKIGPFASKGQAINARIGAYLRASPPAAIPAAPSDARKLCDMYQQLAEAMGYHSGEGGMEFSPEEWASALLRDATAFRAITQPTTVQQVTQDDFEHIIEPFMLGFGRDADFLRGMRSPSGKGYRVIADYTGPLERTLERWNEKFAALKTAQTTALPGGNGEKKNA